MIARLPEQFETRRLRAERLTAAHYEVVLQMHQDPVHMATLGGIKDAVQTRDYLDRNLTHWDEYGFGLWMLLDRADGQLVGRGLLRHLVIDGQDDVEVGYGFTPAFWGRGLATEIATACVALGFEQLQLPSVVALTLAGNLASQNVLRKAGLQLERQLMHAGLPHVFFRGLNRAGASQ